MGGFINQKLRLRNLTGFCNIRVRPRGTTSSGSSRPVSSRCFDAPPTGPGPASGAPGEGETHPPPFCRKAKNSYPVTWHLWGTWKISFLLEGPLVSCHVSERVGISSKTCPTERPKPPTLGSTNHTQSGHAQVKAL